eukprot:5462235-Amphidinium_carterae.1
MDSGLTTRVVLLGQVHDSMPLQQVLLWATSVLGIAAEVREDKQFKQSQSGPSISSQVDRSPTLSGCGVLLQQCKGDGIRVRTASSSACCCQAH